MLEKLRFPVECSQVLLRTNRMCNFVLFSETFSFFTTLNALFLIIHGFGYQNYQLFRVVKNIVKMKGSIKERTGMEKSDSVTD